MQSKLKINFLIFTFVSQVEQRRGLTFGKGSGYRLILRDVSEYGWTNSKVTKYRYTHYTQHILASRSLNLHSIYFHIYRTDAANNKIIYSQDFPEKSLNGEYEFKALLLGSTYFTKGVWNMTLYDYA